MLIDFNKNYIIIKGKKRSMRIHKFYLKKNYNNSSKIDLI